MSEVGTSLYRLADAEVLIGVAETPGGPQPLFTDVDGEPAVVAFTDLAEAQSELPETHRLFSIVVAELAAQLPPHAGIVVDPRSASPAWVPAASKQAVVEAAQAFPAGADVRIGEPADEPEALLEAVRAGAPGVPGLQRVWRTWYQAADARPRLLVVVDVADPASQGEAAADLVLDAARTTAYGPPVLVMALPDLPEAHRAWLLEHTPPSYESA